MLPSVTASQHQPSAVVAGPLLAVLVVVGTAVLRCVVVVVVGLAVVSAVSPQPTQMATAGSSPL